LIGAFQARCSLRDFLRSGGDGSKGFVVFTNH